MYKSFLNSYFMPGFRFKNENLNCDNCSMAKQGIYRADLKCCTYFPFLTNYILGAGLLYSPKIKDILNAKIQARQFVFPLGLMPSWSYRVAHKFKSSLDFGNREDLLCPFYLKEKGQCTIWPFRNSACSSFHCEVSGTPKEEIHQYWEKYQEAFHYLEMALSQYTLMAFGYSQHEIDLQIEYLEGHERGLDPEKTHLTQKEYKSVWGDYCGREEHFFLSARDFQENIPFKDYLEVLGDEGLAKFEDLKEYPKRVNSDRSMLSPFVK